MSFDCGRRLWKPDPAEDLPDPEGGEAKVSVSGDCGAGHRRRWGAGSGTEGDAGEVPATRPWRNTS